MSKNKNIIPVLIMMFGMGFIVQGMLSGQFVGEHTPVEGKQINPMIHHTESV